MLFRHRGIILLKRLEGLRADPTGVSTTRLRQPVLRSRRPIPVDRKAAQEVFKRLMLCNRISVIVKSACCTVSNLLR